MIKITPHTFPLEFNKNFIVGSSIKDTFRIDLIRKIGKISFLNLSKDLISFQAILEREVSSISFKRGNIVEIAGAVILNNKSKEILRINKIILLEQGKELIDSNYYSLKDKSQLRTKTIYRLTTIKENIVERSLLYEALRKLLRKKEYLETICPVITKEYGGANSKSFNTYRKEIEYNLSICPELYLKRYLLAGFSKIYSIHRCFRNEGIDSTHYPEFEMIQIYEVGASAEEMKNLFFQFITLISEKYNIQTKYKTRSYFEDPSFTMEKYERELKNNRGWLVVNGLPHSESPLCKEKKPGLSDQIQIYYDSLEVANIYTEQTNHKKLRESFKTSKGDTSSKEEFLQDFEHEIPPTGGMGFGLDRLLMILLKREKLEEVLPFLIFPFK